LKETVLGFWPEFFWSRVLVVLVVGVIVGVIVPGVVGVIVPGVVGVIVPVVGVTVPGVQLLLELTLSVLQVFVFTEQKCTGPGADLRLDNDQWPT
jgi:hypothetical protein